MFLFCCFCYEIFTGFYEVNIRITFILLIIFKVYRWTLTGLKHLVFFFDYPGIIDKHHVNIWLSNMIIKILRNVFVDLSIIVLHFICFHHKTIHLNIILLRHFIGDIEWQLIFRCIFVSLLYCYKNRFYVTRMSYCLAIWTTKPVIRVHYSQLRFIHNLKAE